MTRKSRREIESTVADLTGDKAETDLANAAFRFVYAGDETGDREPDLVTADGFAFYTGSAES